jgi:hypothetical protein
MSPRRNWDSPNPSLASECAGGRGHTRLLVRCWGSPNSDDLRKSVALCLLCGLYTLIQVMCKVWFGCIFAPTVVSCGGGFFCSLIWILPAIVSAGTVGEGKISESMIQCQYIDLVRVNFINIKIKELL